MRGNGLRNLQKENHKTIRAMKNPDEIQRKIMAYKSRICNMILYPNDCDPDILDWYKKQIEELEAELAVDELLCEVEQKITPPQVHKLWTDNGTTVWGLCRKANVTKIEVRWSWRWFNWMFYVEYF
jgi:hypothetical protein